MAGTILASAYAMVAFALLSRLVFGHLNIWRIVHRAKLLEGRQLTEISVRESDEITVPLTVGVGRSAVVILPTGFASTASPERLEAVLAHETAHVRRGDYATQTYGDIVCALYFVNPLVWILGSAMRGEAERAADDHVLAGNAVRPSEYAAHLLETVRNLQGRRGIPGVAVTMAQRSEVSTRIGAVLAANVSRAGRLSASGLVGMGLVCTVMAIGIARVGLARGTESSNRSTKAAATPISPFRQTLTDGTVVEVEAVAASAFGEPKAPLLWRPDGRLLTKPQNRAKPGVHRFNIPFLGSQPLHRFILSLRGPRIVDRQVVESLRIDVPRSEHKTATMEFGGSDQMFMAQDAFMHDPARKATIQVRIPRSDWHPLLAVTAFKTIIAGNHQELGNIKVTSRFQSHGEQFDTDVRMTHPVQTNKGTELAVTYKILKKGIVANAGCRFIAETWQGKEVTGQVRKISSNGSTIMDKVLLADTPIARVKSFRVEARILDQVIFNGIALQPQQTKSEDSSARTFWRGHGEWEQADLVMWKTPIEFTGFASESRPGKEAVVFRWKRATDGDVILETWDTLPAPLERQLVILGENGYPRFRSGGLPSTIPQPASNVDAFYRTEWGEPHYSGGTGLWTHHAIRLPKTYLPKRYEVFETRLETRPIVPMRWRTLTQWNAEAAQTRTAVPLPNQPHIHVTPTMGTPAYYRLPTVAAKPGQNVPFYQFWNSLSWQESKVIPSVACYTEFRNANSLEGMGVSATKTVLVLRDGTRVEPFEYSEKPNFDGIIMSGLRAKKIASTRYVSRFQNIVPCEIIAVELWALMPTG